MLAVKIEGNEIIYSCGCKFKIIDKGPPLRIDLDINYDAIKEDCTYTWDFIGTGNCKGMFQIEGRFGQQLAKNLKPNNMEHLSALNAIIRPGCTESKIDGKSLTDHYIDRKNGKEEVKYLTPALEPILNETYGILAYQESQTRIVKELAGFTMADAEILRRGVGKKKKDVIMSLKDKFLEGCSKVGKVNREEAEEIFGWILASARYGFNKSISPSTLIETKNGFKTVDEVQVGEYIKCPSDIPHGVDEYCEVINKYDHGILDVYEVQLESGKKIQCTINHKFLCENGSILPLYEILQENYKIVAEDD